MCYSAVHTASWTTATQFLFFSGNLFLWLLTVMIAQRYNATTLWSTLERIRLQLCVLSAQYHSVVLCGVTPTDSWCDRFTVCPFCWLYDAGCNCKTSLIFSVSRGVTTVWRSHRRSSVAHLFLTKAQTDTSSLHFQIYLSILVICVLYTAPATVFSFYCDTECHYNWCFLNNNNNNNNHYYNRYCNCNYNK